MHTQPYLIAWIVYLTGVLGCMIVFFHMTCNIKSSFTKQAVRYAVALIMIVPVYSSSEHRYLTPAIITAILDLLSKGIGTVLSSPAFAMILLSIVMGVCMSYMNHKKRSTK